MALSLGVSTAAWADEHADAVPPAEPVVAVIAGSTAPPSTPAATPMPATSAHAVDVDPQAADARVELSEQQRRLMLLLLMNSAGSVRPYGGLGR